MHFKKSYSYFLHKIFKQFSNIIQTFIQTSRFIIYIIQTFTDHIYSYIIIYNINILYCICIIQTIYSNIYLNIQTIYCIYINYTFRTPKHKVLSHGLTHFTPTVISTVIFISIVIISKSNTIIMSLIRSTQT